MPLARGTSTAPPPGPGPDVPTRAVAPEPGIYVPEFIAPNGVVLPLNPPDPEFFTTRGVSGLGLAPRELVTTDNPAGGVIVDFTRVRERTIIWPVRMYGRTHEAFIERFRSTAELFALTETMGPGLLRITRGYDPADQREIPCFYQSGFEQEAEDGAWLRGGAVLNLLCPSPWWQDVRVTPYEREESELAPYLAPYPSYSTGQVLGETTFTNNGQREVWPSWTIRGPMTSLTATNVTRGESFKITYGLARGEVVTLSSQPIEIRGPAGQPINSALNLLEGGEPWRLDPKVRNGFNGESRIVFAAAGAAGESSPGAKDATLVRAEFKQMWETA